MPFQVHGDHRVPLGLVHVDEHPVAEDPGVVDEDVELAEPLDRVLDEPTGALEVGDVLAVGDRLARRAPRSRRRRRGQGIASAPSPSSDAPRSLTTMLAPSLRERERVLAADPAPGAGDDRDLAVEETHQSRSIEVAVPSPPPQHIVTSPSVPSVRSSSCRSVVEGARRSSQGDGRERSRRR